MSGAAAGGERVIYVRVAVSAAVGTGIVRTYVHACNTAAGGTLIFITLRIKPVTAYAFKPLTVYAGGVSYAVSA